MSQRWHVPTDLLAHVAAFEDAYVLYNPRSGQTHLLNTAALRAMEALHESSGTLDDLLIRLVPEPLDVDQVSQYRRLFWELDRLGLILPVLL